MRLKIDRFLPFILASITGVPRYLPKIKWERKLWVHNIFRVYELIFWKRHGVQADATSIKWRDENGWHIAHYSHTWENFFTVVEVKIRSMLHGEFIPIRVWIPMMQTPQGVPVFASPYVFAITFDASSITTSHTSSGSDRTIFNSFFTTGGDTVTAADTGGVSASKDNSVERPPGGSNRYMALWHSINQPTGAQTITVTGAYALIASTSYTGCDQTTQPDVASTTGTALAGTSLAISNTSSTNNSLLVGCFGNFNFAISAGTDTQNRADAASGVGMYDATSLTSPAGSKTLTVTPTAADDMMGVVAHIRPTAATAANVYPVLTLLGVG